VPKRPRARENLGEQIKKTKVLYLNAPEQEKTLENKSRKPRRCAQTPLGQEKFWRTNQETPSAVPNRHQVKQETQGEPAKPQRKSH
jgi:hypothetical protein